MREIKTDIGALMPIIEEKLAAGGEVLFSPNGVSMLPTLRPGTDKVVLAAAPDKLRKYDIALFRCSGGQYVLHRVIGVGETYTFIGDNKLEYERDVAREDIIALCVARIRNGKRIRLDSSAARMRARIRHAARPIKSGAARVARKLKSMFK